MADASFNEFSFSEDISVCPHNSADWAEMVLDHRGDATLVRYHCGTTRSRNANEEINIHQSVDCMMSELLILRYEDLPVVRRQLREANDRVTLLAAQVQDKDDLIGQLQEALKGAGAPVAFELAFSQPIPKE